MIPAQGGRSAATSLEEFRMMIDSDAKKSHLMATSKPTAR